MSLPSAAPRPHRWWRGLAARSTLALGAMLATLGVALTAISALGVQDATAGAIEKALAGAAERLAVEIADDGSAYARLSRLAQGSNLSYAFLVAPDGALLAGAGAAAPAFTPAAIEATKNAGVAALTRAGGAAHAAKAVTLADGRHAVLRVGGSLEAARVAAGETAARGLLATLAALLFALPAAALAFDSLASPLRALTRAVTRPGDAQDELRRAGTRGDEIGALARAHLSTAQRLAESADALHRLTFDDPITRLPNRASMTSRLAAALLVGQPVALLEIEVEGLTRVSAALGQQQGDLAVVGAADRLREAAAEWARRSNLIAPLGADLSVTLARISDAGFAMLAYGAEAAAAEELARLAIAAFDPPLALGERRVSLRLAIGIAIAPSDGDEAGTLLRSAAAALSAARQAGPQSARSAGVDLVRQAYGRLRLEEELRRAIEQDELEVHYQPQIDLRTGAVAGAEALVRWRHPVRGMVSPGEFVPVAEESGLVEPLGRVVLAEASRTSVAWAAMGIDVRIAVNVSTLQFRSPTFAESTLAIIRAARADPSRIELEITESAAMGDPTHAARELGRLKAAGIRVAIDDFGTGYSNLSTLTRLPFDVLKIDQAFVRDALVTPASRVVVGTVIGMAATLGVETVAEGVETEEQLAFVTAHGCDVAQGYLYAKPMPAAAFEAWYANRMLSNLRALGARGVLEQARGVLEGALAPSLAAAPEPSLAG
jgi:predicted signal transduction protein with EAL and GGDEF domain